MKRAALILGLVASPALATGEARLIGEVAFDLPRAYAFGGLSAIEMRQGGAEALLLSDRGRLFTLRLDGAGDGLPEAALIGDTTLTTPGGTLPDGRAAMDSEGMARLADGRLALSFEGDMRFAIHAADGRELARIAPPPEAGLLPPNGGYEALAADAEGRLYTVAERAPGSAPHALWRHDEGGWHVFARLPRQSGFRPVALDFDDRGRLTLLERRFAPLGGFAARITRYGVTADGLGPQEVLLETRPGIHGNLEGLSLWRDGQGRLIASMVADNDLIRFRPNSLVSYRLPD
ncbi:hypothetical protein roselon_00921 [Roseibacterium elongatum DSM 19469]|uniref:Phytase-like domain-containing protein n=1 Tax=Roseicyclus elongatus DSM 19469 TaxID=1294273 RepID=W8S3H9_9RHOB|nr:hypothetical protein roselon_00921 [Roseibacterium elongatum DSM 19469]